MIGIYQIVNTKNNKRYVGQSVDLEDRLAHHRNSLVRGYHDNKHLLRSWNKYGANAFRFETLLTCSVEHLTFFEQDAYDFFESIYGCYNEGPFLDSPSRGKKPSKETLRNMSKAKAGKNHPFWGKFGEDSANWGSRWNLTEETKRKMSKAQMGNTNGLGNTNALGNILSKETRHKMSESRRGDKNPTWGKPRTEETKRKISMSLKLMWAKRKSGGVPSDS